MATAPGDCQARKALGSRQTPAKEESEMELGGFDPDASRVLGAPLSVLRRRAKCVQRCQAIPEASCAWPGGIAGREREISGTSQS